MIGDSIDMDAKAGGTDTRVTPDRLRTFTRSVFQALGMRGDDASLLADHLLWAELRGATALGVRKIPLYARRIRAGGTSVSARPEIIKDQAAVAVIDAKDTFGQVVGVQAMRLAIAKARVGGVGYVVVRNTTSAGALGYYAMMAADDRMIGLAINNTEALQPAWGGAEKIIGNQAFAVGSAAGRHDPLVLDMATSAMSMARIHEYDDRGELLPPDVALSSDGQPTVDPATALAGMLLPMGGHRGYGLSVMWEILTGVLSGGPSFSELLARPVTDDRAMGTSIFCLAINPEFVLLYQTFVDRVDDVVDRVQASRRAPGVDRIRMPGQRGHENAAQRSRHGIQLPAELVDKLARLGAELNVPW